MATRNDSSEDVLDTTTRAQPHPVRTPISGLDSLTGNMKQYSSTMRRILPRVQSQPSEEQVSRL
jgi:hypothetical protein